MRKHKIFRNVVAMLLSAVIIFGIVPCQVFAAETSTVEPVDPGVEPRETTYSDCLVWDNASTSITVKLTHNLTLSSYKEYYGLLSVGSYAMLVLRFYNQSTGRTYSLSFICDGTYRSENPGVMVPVGYYTVTKASFPCIGM
jgi:hypothetical protein